MISLVETDKRQLEIIKLRISRLTEQNSNQNPIEFHTKDIQNLENCLLTTHEELLNQRNKVRQSQLNVKIVTQKMHRIITNERPIIKEIFYDQKQMIQNDIIHKQLELNTRKNEEKIKYYKTMIGKLIFDWNKNDRILKQENLFLKQLDKKTEKSKENWKILNKNFKSSENNYQYLKEIFREKDCENKQLKQQYTDLTFIIQLLGQRQAIFDNKLQPLYKKLKHLTTQHHEKSIKIFRGKVMFHTISSFQAWVLVGIYDFRIKDEGRELTELPDSVELHLPTTHDV